MVSVCVLIALAVKSKKIMYALKLMQAERETYDELVADNTPLNSSLVVESAKRFNGYRQEAVTARLELILHRRAVGLVVDNHKIVHEKFPIGERMPVHDGEETIAKKNR
jgi:hypothetical protein